MAEIIWTEEAERWLKDIHDYIVQDNPAAAAKVVSGIYQRVQILSSFRRLGTNTDQNRRGISVYISIVTIVSLI
jgi:plasmid stabilization system protein ParE